MDKGVNRDSEVGDRGGEGSEETMVGFVTIHLLREVCLRYLGGCTIVVEVAWGVEESRRRRGRGS